MAKTNTPRDSRQPGRRVVEGRPGQGSGASRAHNTEGAMGKPDPDASQTDEVRQLRAERTRKAIEAANEEADPREELRAQASNNRGEISPELLEKDTENYPSNTSTPSQQPTMLETKGGTEQPHPTMAPRAARSGRGLEPPPGRSHDNSLHTAGPKGDGTLRVRATQTGYYNHIRRREGDVFTLVPRTGMLLFPVYDQAKKDDNGNPVQRLHPRTGEPLFEQRKGTLSAEEQFSENWMQIVSDDEVETTSTAKDAIRKRHDEILGGQSRTVDKDVTGADA